MKTKVKAEDYVFKGVKIVAWLIFIGLCVEAGGLLVNFIVSLTKPEMVNRLYQKLDLTSVYESSKFVFFGSYSFILSIAMLKAVLFYWVILLVSKMNLSNPFSRNISKLIYTISYYTFAIGLINVIGKQWVKGLGNSGYELSVLQEFWDDSQAFILMAAVIYIIAIIFTKGVAYQEELEETV